jgi:hypothetical protein
MCQGRGQRAKGGVGNARSSVPDPAGIEARVTRTIACSCAGLAGFGRWASPQRGGSYLKARPGTTYRP